VGLLSNLAHIYANPISTVPSLGASGAISGVLGAYILLYPRAKVATLIFLLFFFYVIDVPAWIFLGLWFLLQIVNGTSSVGSNAGGIAYWAHIGGFVSGFIIILFLRRKRKEDFLKYF
jgi:membrane associated rhomboid family serine protease